MKKSLTILQNTDAAFHKLGIAFNEAVGGNEVAVAGVLAAVRVLLEHGQHNAHVVSSDADVGRICQAVVHQLVAKSERK